MFKKLKKYLVKLAKEQVRELVYEIIDDAVDRLYDEHNIPVDKEDVKDYLKDRADIYLEDW